MQLRRWLVWLASVTSVVCAVEHVPLLRLTKRSPGDGSLRCSRHEDCTSQVPGSVCVQSNCVCPQGYLPDGCFRVDGSSELGRSCDASAPCGGELVCRAGVCGCPEGFQMLLAPEGGASLCLLWHRTTRVEDRCRSNEECRRRDPNAVCKKRFCQCGPGHQLFETVLFGRRHRCFETSPRQCQWGSQCASLEQEQRHCTCLFNHCHCLADANFTDFDIPPHSPNWYQRWKKDIVLATRLLFVTVVLFFVPCFIYVTLGMRERSRHLFSQLVHAPPAVHYHRQRRIPHCPPPPRHNLPASPQTEDPPPSYEEIVRKEEPPPPYGSCR